MSLYKMAEKQVIKEKHLIKLFLGKSVSFQKLHHKYYDGSHTSFLYIVL